MSKEYADIRCGLSTEAGLEPEDRYFRTAINYHTAYRVLDQLPKQCQIMVKYKLIYRRIKMGYS